MSEVKPNSLPWNVNGKQSIRGANGEYIAKANWRDGAEHAAFIVRACNSHGDLLEGLKSTTASLVAAVSLLKRGTKKAAPSDTMFDMMIADYEKAIEAGRSAIAKAEGRS